MKGYRGEILSSFHRGPQKWFITAWLLLLFLLQGNKTNIREKVMISLLVFQETRFFSRRWSESLSLAARLGKILVPPPNCPFIPPEVQMCSECEPFDLRKAPPHTHTQRKREREREHRRQVFAPIKTISPVSFAAKALPSLWNKSKRIPPVSPHNPAMNENMPIHWETWNQIKFSRCSHCCNLIAIWVTIRSHIIQLNGSFMKFTWAETRI